MLLIQCVAHCLGRGRTVIGVDAVLIAAAVTRDQDSGCTVFRRVEGHPPTCRHPVAFNSPVTSPPFEPGVR